MIDDTVKKIAIMTAATKGLKTGVGFVKKLAIKKKDDPKMEKMIKFVESAEKVLKFI